LEVENPAASNPSREFKELKKSVNMSVTERIDIKPGQRVLVVLKPDQRSGKLTEGIVKNILTRSSVHPHGIKVRLENGLVGRVKEIKP
jgi:uncharacterized repeat protein (TIGR03833 family)